MERLDASDIYPGDLSPDMNADPVFYFWVKDDFRPNPNSIVEIQGIFRTSAISFETPGSDFRPLFFQGLNSFRWAFHDCRVEIVKKRYSPYIKVSEMAQANAAVSLFARVRYDGDDFFFLLMYRSSHVVSSPSRLYPLEFFVSAAIAFPTYTLSSYLATLMPEAQVGVWYAIGAVLTFVLLALAPHVLSWIGNYALAFLAAFFICIALFEFAFPAAPLMIPVVFVLYTALISLAFFALDIFFESVSKDQETGGIRSIMFTASNAAFFLAPLVISYVLDDGEYGKIFSLASACMVVAIILLFPFRGFRDPTYPKAGFRDALTLTWRNRELRFLFVIRTLLKFSAALLAIYAPIYLHDHLGFGWDVIGKLLAFMLLPSIILNVPAGRVADRWIGEKELLITGFIVVGMSLSALTFLNGISAFIWAACLFLAQGGLSLINIMTETHFYKRVNAGDAGVISLYKNSNQVAYFLVAILTSGFLIFFPLRYVFLVLGLFVTVAGIPLSLALRDTK
jgi:predicted MFS family arabinose efflux permease